MNTRKRWLARIMAVVMLFSLLPSSAFATLLPIREEIYTLNFYDYKNSDLENLSIESVLAKLDPASDAAAEDVAVWTKCFYYDENGEYVGQNDNYIPVKDGKIDLSNGTGSNWYGSICDLELIVGTDDQLDPDNVRYLVDVRNTRIRDLFTATAAYETGGVRYDLGVYETSALMSGKPAIYNELSMFADPFTEWDGKSELYLSLDFAPQHSLRGLTAKVYEGYHTTVYEAELDTEITDMIWQQDDVLTSGGYFADCSFDGGYDSGVSTITIVLYENGEVLHTIPLMLYVENDALNWSFGTVTAEENGDRIEAIVWSYCNEVQYYDTRLESYVRTMTHQMEPGLPADAEYYADIHIYDPANPSKDDSCVKHAYVGHYTKTQLAAMGDSGDIKAQLCSDAYVDGGYLANYSKGVDFTIVDVLGEVWYFTITTGESVEEPETSDPLAPPAPSQPNAVDTYFDLTSVSADGGGMYHKIPFQWDSYYYNGYQTMFLVGSDGSEATPYRGDTITPRFYEGENVTVYASVDGASGTKQISGQTDVPFVSGAPIQYEAIADKDGKVLKNYWVTFVTIQEGGPKLFVNATNVEEHYDIYEAEENTDPIFTVYTYDEDTDAYKIPEREVFLDSTHGYYHDILFANIGDEEMTDIFVKLEDAENVKLDDYWTVKEDGVRKLAACKVEDYLSSNRAKIRLVPETDAQGYAIAGDIGGYLTIGYGDPNDPTEAVTIKLSGNTGAPKISTDELVEGVKFVPYSSVIMTSSMYNPADIEFSISEGNLPTGLELKENGEIYGVPKAVGSYTFTVKASCGDIYDEREFTLHIVDNSDDNVSESTDVGYEISQSIPTSVTDVYKDYLFVSVGEFDHFENLWLDGDRLTQNTDYVAQEGSTKITIRAQTFQNLGSGKHTIAAEFRDAQSGELKRAAQNFTISAGSDTGDGGGGGGYTGPVNTPGKPAKPDDDNKQTVGGFTDVPADAYYAAAVKWAIEKGITNGTSTTTFSPNAACTRAQMLTFLYRAMGSPAVSGDASSFTDVPEGAYYEDVVAWAVENGITKGVAEGIFAPDLNCTRAQIVTAICRTVGGSASGESGFADVPADAYYAGAVAWAVEKGITNGTGDGMFSPDAVCTRAQMVTFLYRCFAE